MKVISVKKNNVMVQKDSGEIVFVLPELYLSDINKAMAYAVPYSLPFDLFLDYDGQNVCQQLYTNGIHTLRDVLDNRRTVKRVLGDKNSVESLIERIKGE